CILYTHLGKLAGQRHFSEPSVRAFRTLARYQQDGEIMVTTTRRHLDYARVQSSLQWTVSSEGASTIIRLNVTDTAAELQGLTFYVPDPETVQIHLTGVGCLRSVINPPDETGRASVSLPWSPLEFP